VAAAEDKERKLIAVILGCERIEDRYKDAIALFEAGFQEKKVVRTLLSKGFDLFTYPIQGGKTAVQAFLAQDVSLAYYPSEEPAFKTSITWEPLSLPIAAEQRVGVLNVFSDRGSLLASAPLFATKPVEATLSHRAHLAWTALRGVLAAHVAWLLVLGGVLIVGGTYLAFHFPKKPAVREKAE
jgi:D-alanyl-D-alanine carboxypeptidase